MSRSSLSLSDGQACHLAIRPEKVDISKTKPADDNVLQGEVIDIAYLGNLSTYHVRLANGQMIRAQKFNTEHTARREITWEDKIWLSWSDDAAVLLEQ